MTGLSSHTKISSGPASTIGARLNSILTTSIAFWGQLTPIGSAVTITSTEPLSLSSFVGWK